MTAIEANKWILIGFVVFSVVNAQRSHTLSNIWSFFLCLVCFNASNSVLVFVVALFCIWFCVPAFFSRWSTDGQENVEENINADMTPGTLPTRCRHSHTLRPHCTAESMRKAAFYRFCFKRELTGICCLILYSSLLLLLTWTHVSRPYRSAFFSCVSVVLWAVPRCTAIIAAITA